MKKRLPIAKFQQLQQLPQLKQFASSFRFTLQKKLLLAFIFIAILFCFLGLTARTALKSGETAVQSVLATNYLVRMAKEGNINLAKAGQLPKVIETASADMAEVEAELARLQEKFTQISSEIRDIASEDEDATELELVNAYLKLGSSFYEALAGFVPTRKSMLIYTTEYKGGQRPLPDVLAEREIGHIKFVRSLGASIAKKERLTGGMDYTVCPFYLWYTESPPQDPDVAEIFEEIDPLHQKLHNYAKEIDARIGEGDSAAAEKILLSANKDLNQLGLYFGGVRSMAQEKYEAAQKKFYGQLADLDAIYDQTVKAAAALEAYLQDTVMQGSLGRMKKTTDRNRLQTMLFSVLGLVLAILIGGYATFVIRQAIRSLQRVVDALTGSGHDFDTMSAHLAENSSATMTLASSASSAMEKTASSIDSVAAAVQEMNASIQEISNSSMASAEMAGAAVKEAKQATSIGTELQRLSEGIGTVSGTIRSIAFKINLLSLNANVEAARAGEAGAGFAVVAAEVKTLAEATAAATDEITEKIEAIQKGSKTSARAIATITDTITRMSDNSAGIAAAMQEQSALTTDIGGNVNQVAQASNDVTDDIHNVSDAASDTNERSSSIRDGAKNLNEYAEELNRLVRLF